MAFDPAAIVFYRELLARYFAEWQAQAGTQAQPQMTLAAFLSAINNNEAFWRELSDGLVRHGLASDLARLRATLSTIDCSDAGAINAQLQTLDLPENELIMICELMLAGLPRDERVRQAFAAKDPAAVARALERIAGAEHQRFDVKRLESWLYADVRVWPDTNVGKIGAAGLLFAILLAIYYIGCESSSNRPYESPDRQAGISTFIYKGVTPELHG